MKKSEFKKKLSKENVSAKRYTPYSIIITLLFVIVVGLTLYLQFTEVVETGDAIISNAIMILIVVIPYMIIDLQNDSQIKKLYEEYKKENKMSEYKDKTKYLKVILILEIVVTLIASVYFIFNNNINNSNNNELSNTLTITTNKGKVIETEYEDMGDFSVKIPKEFGLMSEEALAIKYPNGNLPTMAYTNDNGSINIVFNLNDVEMADSDIKTYIKQMEDVYKQYVDADTMNVEYFKIDGHQIGQIEFVSSAPDTDIYNRLVAFSVNGKLRIVSFNCTEKYMDEWKDVSEFIINSLKFEK